jgi:hypothetical protein
MQKHNQVKWTDPQGVHYGDVRGDYDELAKKEAKRGNLVIDDALEAVYHVVPEAAVIDIPFEFGHYDHKTGRLLEADELHMFVDAEFHKAQALSDSRWAYDDHRTELPPVEECDRHWNRRVVCEPRDVQYAEDCPAGTH